MGRDELASAIDRAVRELAFVEHLRMHQFASATAMSPTDIRALLYLMERADAGVPVTPGDLCARLNLTSGAVTAVIDRLEQGGHVQRRPHPHDRRSTIVEHTEHAAETGRAHFAAVAARMAAVHNHYSADELRLIARFLEETVKAVDVRD